MRVRDAIDARQEHIPHPRTGRHGNRHEPDEERQHPDVARGSHKRALLDLLREPAREDDVDGEQDVSRDGQQVGFEHAVAQVDQNEREVVGDRLKGDVCGDPELHVSSQLDLGKRDGNRPDR
jgi:hypothetical protein